MLSLTRKTDYALVALVSLAERASQPQCARELSDRLRLPQAALRNILKDLTRHGLLTSRQGTAGGYSLARSAREISLTEVIQAIEGPARLTPCCSPTSLGDDACRREDACRIKATVRNLNRRLNGFLTDITLDDLALEQTEPSTAQSALSGMSGTIAVGVDPSTPSTHSQRSVRV